MLGYHLNRHGHFFMICPGDGQAIGFVKLAQTAFADLRAVSVIAKINPENTRSRRLAAACGFREMDSSEAMTLFQAKCG